MLRLRVIDSDLFLRHVRLRMPFRFGSARMTEAPVAHLRLTVEDAAGRRTWGVAADLLPPAWFDKRPGRTPQQDLADLLASASIARQAYMGRAPATPFELWHDALAHAMASGAEKDLAPLAAGWGVALYERAIMDAAGRLRGRPAWQLIHANELGVDLGRLHPDLSGLSPADVLPERPLQSIHVRHTVGLIDPLTEAELTSDQRLNDGLPQTLEAVIAFYGTTYFKVKISGDVRADLARLERIAAVLDVLPDYRVTMDGNEQYRSWDDLAQFAEGLQQSPQLRRFNQSVLYVEQPIYRERALSDDEAASRARVAAWRPLLIDESDDRLEAWPRAAELGYRGVSFKGCKGFIKGLRNRALAQVWQRAGRGEFFLSGEDLTAPALIPVQQDVTLAATLGIAHQERNGHHYIRGLDWLTADERQQALRDHPDVYTADGNLPRLRIEAGRLRLASLLEVPGLAVARPPDWTSMKAVAGS